jgi:hypothetical protein
MSPQEYRNEAYRIYEEDMEKAVELFEKAASLKDIPAAVALAAYYYDEECDESAAKDWLEKAFAWFEEAGNPEEFAEYVAFGHYEMGMILYQCELDCAGAWLEFTKAVDAGYAEAYASMGTMLYEGDWTPDGNPDVNGAVKLWETGMNLGSEKCAELYEEHKGETVKAPKTITFENGDVYKGDVNAEGLPHGNGHMDYKLNGYWGEYDGAWVDGKRCGKGHYHSMSKGGRRYVHDYKGEWFDDKQHGQGTSKDSSEQGLHCSTVTETYTGGFNEGKRHGHGVLVKDHFDGSFTDGEDRIEGEWEDGKLIGTAVWDYANGDHFEGPLTGHGKYTYANGLSFEGEWENGVLIPDSIKSSSTQGAPLLLVTEHHSGFDYNHTGTFLFPAAKGLVRYETAAAISRDSDFGTKQGLEITEVTPGSVSFVVESQFMKDRKGITDTLRRGESRLYADSHKACATIYDEDYDYTVEDSLEVKVL